MIRERTIADLEFEQVLSLVRRHSLSEGGKEKISPSAFTSDESVIASRAARIEEILERIIEGKVSLSPFVSLSSLFETYERKVPGALSERKFHHHSHRMAAFLKPILCSGPFTALLKASA